MITLPYYYASRKVDGLRCSFYWDGKEIKSASRGGGDYDFGTTHIRKHPLLIQFFKEHPSIKLDGELYKHGWSLAKINSAARMEKTLSSARRPATTPPRQRPWPSMNLVAE